MNRTATIAGALLALLLVVAATAVAAPRDRHPAQAPVADESQAEQPQGDEEPQGDEDTDEDAGPPSQALLDRVVANLGDAGITTDADAVSALAEKYGVGGAVRLIAWADASGMSTDELAAMFDSGMGWGQIARQLGEDGTADVGPGIGWIMGGGNGHPGGNGMGLGRANAPGQQKKP